MRSFTASPLLVLAALAAACAPPPPPAPAAPDAVAIRSAIEARLASFGPAMQSKDVAAASAIFTDDATWIHPDATTFRGRAEIEKGLAGFFDSYESATPGTVNIERLVVVSDTEAVTFSRAAYSVTMKGKQPENRTNPFADHWQKGADGVWRIAYEINADGVAPEMAATMP